MRNLKIAVMVVTSVCALSLTLSGCSPTETRIRTETERTERVIDEQFVDPGDQDNGGGQEAGDPKTHTETRERVIEEDTVVK